MVDSQRATAALTPHPAPWSYSSSVCKCVCVCLCDRRHDPRQDTYLALLGHALGPFLSRVPGP